MTIDLEAGAENELGWPERRNTKRFSRNHGMRAQGIGRGQTVFPKHELLNLAHERGLVDIRLQPLLLQEDRCIFTATVYFDDQTQFTDVGDATPQNTNSTTKAALPRMAATRAISRALALAMNVEHNIDVEMPQEEASPRPQRQSAPTQQQRNTNYQRAGGDDEWEDE